MRLFNLSEICSKSRSPLRRPFFHRPPRAFLLSRPLGKCNSPLCSAGPRQMVQCLVYVVCHGECDRTRQPGILHKCLVETGISACLWSNIHGLGSYGMVSRLLPNEHRNVEECGVGSMPSICPTVRKAWGDSARHPTTENSVE
jgi:hypothetical protein